MHLPSQICKTGNKQSIYIAITHSLRKSKTLGKRVMCFYSQKSVILSDPGGCASANSGLWSVDGDKVIYFSNVNFTPNTAHQLLMATMVW